MRPRVMYRDGTLPHQIRIELVNNGPGLAVSCNCRSEPLEIRALWEPGEAQAVWRAHLAGLAVAAS